jgi:hypothetical protein
VGGFEHFDLEAAIWFGVEGERVLHRMGFLKRRGAFVGVDSKVYI